MEDGSSSGLDSYTLGTVVWVKFRDFPWWPAEVVSKTITDEKISELEINTYGDDEGDNTHSIDSLKAIKSYNCSERIDFIKKGRKKFKNKPYYRERFNTAIGLANKKLGIEEVAETTGQRCDQYPSQTEDFEMKRKNLTSSHNSVSSDSHYSKDGTPSREVDHTKELTSTPNSGTASRSHSFTAKLEMTPTRIETQNRSIKRPVKRAKNGSRKGTKKMKESTGSEDNHPTDMINNNINDKVTPCNSSDNESEDDLPAISMTQTPTKGYSSLKDVRNKDLVWVKHSRDPYWPALVMKDGNAKKVVVNFFCYDGPEYSVKDKKKILPYFCGDKDKFEDEGSHILHHKEACKEALWLLRSGNRERGSTAAEQYEAIKNRRSLSQITPCKRMTFSDDGTGASSDDEPKESAFGYDITNNCTNNIHANSSNGGIDEESPKTEVASQFPKGSLYSYEILKENFVSLEHELYSIYKGEIDSENHRIFFQGDNKERRKIQLHNRSGPLYYLHMDHYQELLGIMVSWVKIWSTTDNKEIHEVRYVSDVLLPEATVRTIMKLEHLEKTDAWERFESLE